ncbi:lipoyl synthase [Clostridium algidicarnis]|uniref:lipoyl synthase n=1 Tax=Clostridium algidicarnis TaxID=37659 RepID=UPI001C0D88B6|nr:lipoyl synthase [Clostridium algidicarnis]MBU3206727.1 lipoyl synthase [Clostridium algidicarnis]
MIRKPEWIRVKMQGGTKTNEVNALVSDLSLNTVCSEANCPNRMECFERGTATFMLLGKNCTRNCTFCNVTREAPELVDPMEPENVAKAIKRLGLKHAVITSVTRDDLKDQGAMQFVKVTEEIRKLTPHVSIELLIPDMRGNKDLIDFIINSEPDVLNHNVETVPELYSKVRPMAVFERSLELLEYVKLQKPHMKTKSGIMLGLGETEDQLIRAMKRLVDVHCDMLTLGQYLQPTLKHLDVVEYITPEKFDYYKDVALSLGFKRVSSAPLVRSSYHADALDF